MSPAGPSPGKRSVPELNASVDGAAQGRASRPRIEESGGGVEASSPACDSSGREWRNDEFLPEEDPGTDEERRHFLEVCYSFIEYKDDVSRDPARLSAAFAQLDAVERELCGKEFEGLSAAMRIGINANARFLDLLPCPEVCSADLGPYGRQVVRQVPAEHIVEMRNSSKVRTTLRQFVRDWAVEGQAERAASYGTVADGLARHLPGATPGSGQKKPRVLCPGSGLGRLPFELAARGYAAQGNEFSYHMILGSHLIFNRTPDAFSYMIFPYILCTTQRRGAKDNLYPVRLPDISPSEALPADAELSMASGEFVEVYKRQVESWDGMVTCFFLDTAKNVFLYIRTIAYIMRKGGVWVNLGPLLYHYAEMEHEVSIELSWEEIKPAIRRYFDLVEEERRDAYYTTNPKSLSSTRYRCIFFAAIRNDKPVEGYSNPVY